MWREAGGGIGMGNTCKSMADSCQCMAKTTTIKNQLKKKVCNQQGPTIQHRELCSRSCGSLDGRGVSGRMEACMCTADALCCSPETITTLLISYTAAQNKKLKKKKPQTNNLLDLCEIILPYGL